MDDAKQHVRRKVIMMIGLRTWIGARRLWLIAISVASWAMIGVAGTAEATPFQIYDHQMQTSADYDYRAKVYKVINGVETYLNTVAYDYEGAIWYEGYGWYYEWELDKLVYPTGEGATVIFVVEQRYLGGDWTYFFTSEGVDQQ